MGLYCGIDLHSNNHVLTVIDEADRRVYERRLPNDLAITKAALEPYRAELVAVAAPPEPCADSLPVAPAEDRIKLAPWTIRTGSRQDARRECRLRAAGDVVEGLSRG
jgi:hypothetical protein